MIERWYSNSDDKNLAWDKLPYVGNILKPVSIHIKEWRGNYSKTD